MSGTVLYTAGHGNRSLEQLIGLLQAAGVRVLVDVRAQPYSRHNPQHRGEQLRAGIEGAAMTYHWAGRHLGGLRVPRPDSPHHALPENGLRGYADHMDTGDFQRAAAQLLQLAARASLAVLCAERLPEHCHRLLLSDYLTLQGARVLHLIAPDESREHRLSPAARRESAHLVYDRQVSGTLDL